MELVQAVADDDSEAASRSRAYAQSVCGSLGFGEMQTLVLDQGKKPYAAATGKKPNR